MSSRTNPAMDIPLCVWCTPQETSQHLTPLLATERLTHWHIVVYMWVKWTGSSLIQIMACCLFGTKPFPNRLQVYCQLDTWVKFKLKYNNCPLHKYSWHVNFFFRPECNHQDWELQPILGQLCSTRLWGLPWASYFPCRLPHRSTTFLK